VGVAVAVGIGEGEAEGEGLSFTLTFTLTFTHPPTPTVPSFIIEFKESSRAIYPIHIIGSHLNRPDRDRWHLLTIFQ
jgi:hypothetical protein